MTRHYTSRRLNRIAATPIAGTLTFREIDVLRAALCNEIDVIEEQMPESASQLLPEREALELKLAALLNALAPNHIDI